MDVMNRNESELLHRKLKVARTSAITHSTRENCRQTIRNFRATKAQWMTSLVQPFQVKNKWIAIKISNQQCLMDSNDVQYRYRLKALLPSTARCLCAGRKILMTQSNL